MKKRNLFFLLPFALLIILFFAACTQEQMGIFYSIEKESVLDKSKGLNESLKVWNMAKNTVGTTPTYYIAAGMVYTRQATADGTWDTVDSPAAGMLSSDIVNFQNEIYCVYRSQDGTTSKLYKRSGTSWVEVPVSGDTSERIAGILEIGNYLFIEKYETGTSFDAYYPFSLWYSSDGTTFTQTTITDPSITTASNVSVRQIIDGAFDGTTYWFITGDTMYTGTAPSAITKITPNNTAGNALSVSAYGGIFYSSDQNMLYLTDKSGIVYIRNAATSSNWYPGTTVSTDSFQAVLYDMEEMAVDSSGTIVHFLLIGSDDGYYQLNLDTIDLTAFIPVKPGVDSITSTVNYLNTSLSTASIRKFYVDAGNSGVDDDLVFACTSSSGLWRNELKPDGDVYERVWSRE